MKKPSTLNLLAFFFMILLFFHSVRDSEKYMNYLQLVKSKEILEGAINALEQENTQLENEITKIKNSKSYALKVLRDRYHLTSENEKIIFFSD